MIATLAGDPRRAAEAAVLIRAGKDFSRLSLYPPPERQKLSIKHTHKTYETINIHVYTHTRICKYIFI